MAPLSLYRSLLKRVRVGLSVDETMSVLADTESLFRRATSPLVRLSGLEKVTVCGDVHGQLDDIEKIFEMNGEPSTSNPYLFNGDFVDRGTNSVGCMLSLFLHKLIAPASLHLNRGNHELPEMNAYYGFRKEVSNDTVWRRFNQVFALLPLAHVVNEKVFVVHGGLPRKRMLLREVESVTTDSTEYHEMLWNDPSRAANGFTANPRGEGVFRFGPDITNRFLEDNGLSRLIRSHEVKQKGFEYTHGGRCLTIFSASNYCGEYGNLGAYVTINKDGVVAPPTTYSTLHTGRSRL